MSAQDHLPWSAPMRLDQVGRGVRRRLAATEAERKVIAEELALASLARLEADVEVKPARDGWEITGHVLAEAEQTCGVTLEPLPVEIDARFTVQVVDQAPEAPAEPQEIGLDTEDPPDVAENGVVDLGAYVIEHLALELDPFPRKPGVAFEPPAGEAEPSPFAVLAKLRRDETDR